MKTPRGFTTEPCHGCGDTTIRKKNTVCLICQASIREHHQQVLKLQTSGEERIVLLAPSRGYALPYLGPSHDLLQNLLQKLSWEVSLPTSEYPGVVKGQPEAQYLWPEVNTCHRREWTVARNFPASVVLTLQALFLEPHRALQASQARGKSKDGVYYFN